MIGYIKFRDDTGEVLGAFRVVTANDVPLEAGESVMMHDDPLSVDQLGSYVWGGELLPRPELPAVVSATEAPADDTAACTISGLPDPVVVKIDGEPHTITGGVLELTSPVAATYRLEVTHWPYLDWSCDINFTEPAA